MPSRDRLSSAVADGRNVGTVRVLMTTLSAAALPVVVTATVHVGGQPIGLASGAGSIWVANYGSGEVERVDRVVAQSAD
jgi:hypothetical protein